MDAGDLHHRGICGAIILWSLTEALSHKTSLFFAFNNGTIWIELVGIAPSKIESFLIQRKNGPLKSLALFKTIKFTTHC